MAQQMTLATLLALGLSLGLAACEPSSAPAEKTAQTAATVEASPSSASASAAAAPAAYPSVDANSLAVGKTIYEQACFACHDTGAAGAPKRGDKAAWAARIAQGQPALYQAALKGMNAMPPRGSSGGSDAEIQAAVDYLVTASR